MSSIEQFLAQFPPDQRQLRFSFDYREDGYMVRAILSLPTGSLIARTDHAEPDCRIAINQTLACLSDEIRRHYAQLYEEDRSTRLCRRERDAAAAAPHLAAMYRQHDQEGFFDVLHPLLRQISTDARRTPAVGPLADDNMQPEEIVALAQLDEAVVGAWQNWNDRSPDDSLDRWLRKLLCTKIPIQTRGYNQNPLL